MSRTMASKRKFREAKSIEEEKKCSIMPYQDQCWVNYFGSKLINGEVILQVKGDWNNEINLICLCHWCYDKSCFFSYLISIVIKNTKNGKLHSTPHSPGTDFKTTPKLSSIFVFFIISNTMTLYIG